MKPTFRLAAAFFAFAFLILIFNACETSEINPVQIPSGQDYYPVKVGMFHVYRVDSVEYTFSGQRYQGSFFYKEKISDTLPDQEGSKVFRIEIYSTQDTSSAWHLDSVWSVRVSSDKIIKTENNRPIVKLYFPLKEGSRWDGNQFNTLQDSNSVFWFRVQNLGKTAGFQNKNVESVEIVQKIDSNCINFSYFTEVYFKNIGLGYKRKTYFDYESCTGVPVISQGRSFEYFLIEHGIE